MGMWELLNHGITTTTTNASESFNALMKRYQMNKQYPDDSLVLSFYHLSQCFCIEILRSRYGMGLWTLCDAALHKATSGVPEFVHPDEIYDNICNAGAK